MKDSKYITTKEFRDALWLGAYGTTALSTPKQLSVQDILGSVAYVENTYGDRLNPGHRVMLEKIKACNDYAPWCLGLNYPDFAEQLKKESRKITDDELRRTLEQPEFKGKEENVYQKYDLEPEQAQVVNRILGAEPVGEGTVIPVGEGFPPLRITRIPSRGDCSFLTLGLTREMFAAFASEFVNMDPSKLSGKVDPKNIKEIQQSQAWFMEKLASAVNGDIGAAGRPDRNAWHEATKDRAVREGWTTDPKYNKAKSNYYIDHFIVAPPAAFSDKYGTRNWFDLVFGFLAEVASVALGRDILVVHVPNTPGGGELVRKAILRGRHRYRQLASTSLPYLYELNQSGLLSNKLTSDAPTAGQNTTIYAVSQNGNHYNRGVPTLPDLPRRDK
ncbi:hypothetical protein FACS189449_00210 [Alphaproteobacteria bacterium]|nr:hypothetical protein FACS189449_00210 [Alphaproteobacteria bacterium]